LDTTQTLPTTNGHSPALQTAPQQTIFDARELVTVLKDLMVRVTQDEVTPQTVQAACSCSSQIANILRIHLEAERLTRRLKD
jgi:hypothetical protein